jgi:DNA-binding NarL/FixJ family response regulator
MPSRREGATVLVVDEHETARSLLRRLVEMGWGWPVVGEAGDGLEAARVSRELRPDVVLAGGTVPNLGLAGELVGTSTLLVGLTHSPGQRLSATCLQVSKTLPVDKMREAVAGELHRRGVLMGHGA